MITRRGAVTRGAWGLALFGAGMAAKPAAAEDFTLLVGGAPGSASDCTARRLVPFLARHLGVSALAVRNLPGNGGFAAFTALAKAPPGSGLIGWVATPALPARAVDHDAPALLKELRLLGSVEREPVVFVSPASTPLESVPDIIRRSAEDADAVPLGTPPPGSSAHLAAMRLQALANTRLNILTFPSAAAACRAVTAGNVAVASLPISDAMAELQNGRLAGLGVAAKHRAGVFPDMPALTEGGLPLSASIRRGLAVPAGMPQALCERIAAALLAVASDPGYRTQLEDDGAHTGWLDGAGWAAHTEAEFKELARLWETEPWLSPPDSG
jgi:tripartite-type tricarboxylate transporter receptor subunit TctC